MAVSCKAGVAFAALGSIQNWGPTVTGMVNDVSAQAGLNQTGVLTTFANDADPPDEAATEEIQCS
jgi:hypothetical protein